MSNDPNNNQIANLPSREEAFATLHTEVFQRTFFSKLASYGIVPQTEDEANKMLELAGRLEIAETLDTPAKTAGVSALDLALHRTEQYLAERGYSENERRYEQAEDAAIQKHAAALAANPAIQGAVIVMTQEALAQSA